MVSVRTPFDGTPNYTFIGSSGFEVNPVSNKIRVTCRYQHQYHFSPPLFDTFSLSTAVDGVTNRQDYFSIRDTIPVPSKNRNANENPVTMKSYDDSSDVNPVTNTIYSHSTGLTETPSSDTKLRVFFDSVYYNEFYHTTFLSQPPISGKAINRLSPSHTGISRILISKTTAQASWGQAVITGGAGIDSVSWEWVWGTDTLLFGENLLCAVALDSQTTSTDNSGLGGPFNGNLKVYPIYRIPPPVVSAPVLISPLDNSIGQPVSLTFSWDSVSNATSYRLQVSTNPLFSSSLYTDANISNTSRNVSGLAYDTTYYWRVRARNSYSVGPWSSVWEFSTITVPQEPTLVWPINGDTGVPTTPSLIWNLVGMAETYHLQVATDNSFTNIIAENSSLTDSLMSINDLTGSTVYFWRVRASNVVGTSPWSQIWSFRTALVQPAAPILSSPANGALEIITKPLLAWEMAPTATSYSVQVSTDSVFSSIVINDSNISSQNLQLNGLSVSTNYYWRASASNVSGTGPWSETWNFTTISTPPDPPVLLYPINNALGVSLNPNLLWNPAYRGEAYVVQVSSASDFSSLVVNDSDIASTADAISGLSAYTLYYWRVKAVNAVGESGWSEERNFITGPAAPSIPALVSPVDNSIEQPVSLPLVWNSVSTATSYHVQVAADSGFVSMFTEDTSVVDTLISISGLANSTVYYWRVCAKNTGGTSAWTAPWNFTTIIAPPGTPTLVSPVNSGPDQPLSLSLIWNSVSTPTSYHVQVASDSLFAVIVTEDSTLTDTLAPISGLSNSTTYYWRVRAKNSGGTSNWSGSWNFTTIIAAPPAPVLVSPSDGSIDQLLSLTLTWNTATGATSYDVQLAADTGFAGILFQDSSLTDTFRTATSGLTAGIVNYWRVRAKNAGGTSAWSQVWSFTTIALPSIPLLVSPAGGSADQPVSLSLVWNSVSTATNYHVQVATDTGFTTISADDSLLTDTLKSISGLDNSTTYYWRVRAKNAGGTSGWTAPWSFTTIIAAAPTPAMTLPADGASDQPVSLSLIWNSVSSATGYHVQVASDSLFAVIVTEDSTLTDTLAPISGLSNSTVYYWRVRAKNAGGTSGWTTPWSFTTIIALAGTPLLVFPADGAADQPISLTLVWLPDTLASRYHVQVAADTGFAGMVAEDTSVTDTLMALGGLDSSDTYYWRVRAGNAAGPGPWSEVRSFTTVTSGVRPYQPSLPTIFSITGSSGKISYTLPTACHVRISFFDLRGRLAATLVDRVQAPGRYVLSVKNALPSRGTYIRVFEAGPYLKRDLTVMMGM